MLKGYLTATPCLFINDEDSGYFLAGGIGDESSAGIYDIDIAKIGPEIIEPIF